jgi:predicted DNA-binding protein with PD1-like motif
MDARELSATAEYLVGLEAGDDWRAGIERAAAEAGVVGGWFAGTGGVRDADLWNYDPEREERRTVQFDEPLTVAACTGTVGVDGDDSDPVARPYAVLARPSGQALAGYLNAATVREGRVFLRAFADPVGEGIRRD